MASNGYVTNVPISWPITTSLKADADLGGLKFSYEHGIFYAPTDPPVIVRMPSAYTSGAGAIGRRATGPDGT